MRKSFLWLFGCIAGLILAIVLSFKASTIKIVPVQITNSQTETSVTLAPVAPESNRVTVNFSGVQPVIK